jgi:hypothetical protein
MKNILLKFLGPTAASAKVLTFEVMHYTRIRVKKCLTWKGYQRLMFIENAKSQKSTHPIGYGHFYAKP